MSPELKRRVLQQHTSLLENPTTIAELDTKFPVVQGLRLSGRTMTLRSAQTLTDMSIRGISCRVKAAGAYG